MTLYVALDICALVSMSMDVGDDATVFRRAELLSLLYKGLTSARILLLFDTDGKIHSEYARNLGPNSMARRLLTVAIKHSAVMYGAGTPSNRCALALDRDGFDPADVVFVAIAQRMGGVYVTTEQKHLTISRKDVVATSCGVTVMSLDELHKVLIDRL